MNLGQAFILCLINCFPDGVSELNETGNRIFSGLADHFASSDEHALEVKLDWRDLIVMNLLLLIFAF